MFNLGVTNLPSVVSSNLGEKKMLTIQHPIHMSLLKDRLEHKYKHQRETDINNVTRDKYFVLQCQD